jgi:hypothetical protein
MNELHNLLVWFSLDKSGKIDRISRMGAVDPKLDLDKHFAKWSEQSEHRKANVYTFTREEIEVPDHIMAGSIKTNAIVMHYNGKRHRIIMPYFVAIGGEK